MNDIVELWLPIPGYEGHYEVSDHGQVRSLKRYPRILKTPPDFYGYPTVNLHLNGGIPWKVHRLVLLAFIGPLPRGSETRHLDGDQTNNALSNLIYGTHSENMLDQVRHGTHHKVKKTHCPEGHPYDEANTNRGLNKRVCRTCKRQKAHTRRLANLEYERARERAADHRRKQAAHG